MEDRRETWSHADATRLAPEIGMMPSTRRRRDAIPRQAGSGARGGNPAPQMGCITCQDITIATRTWRHSPNIQEIGKLARPDSVQSLRTASTRKIQSLCADVDQSRRAPDLDQFFPGIAPAAADFPQSTQGFAKTRHDRCPHERTPRTPWLLTVPPDAPPRPLGRLRSSSIGTTLPSASGRKCRTVPLTSGRSFDGREEPAP